MENQVSFIKGPIPPVTVANLLATQNSQAGVGGHSIFVGQVRDDEVDGKNVRAIDYTCYEGMALEKIRAIQDSLSE